MSKSDNLSEDEMVSYLKRTLSPTILVEEMALLGLRGLMYNEAQR